MQNKTFRFGPLALTTTLTTNILNPPTTTGGVNAGSSPQYIILRRIRILNKTTSQIAVFFWLGATGANASGTEILAQGTVIPPRGSGPPLDWSGYMRIDSTDFLVGGCDTATAATIEGEGEIGVAG